MGAFLRLPFRDGRFQSLPFSVWLILGGDALIIGLCWLARLALSIIVLDILLRIFFLVNFLPLFPFILMSLFWVFLLLFPSLLGLRLMLLLLWLRRRFLFA